MANRKSDSVPKTVPWCNSTQHRPSPFHNLQELAKSSCRTCVKKPWYQAQSNQLLLPQFLLCYRGSLFTKRELRKIEPDRRLCQKLFLKNKNLNENENYIIHYTILKLSLKRTGSNELLSRVKAIFRKAVRFLIHRTQYIPKQPRIVDVVFDETFSVFYGISVNQDKHRSVRLYQNTKRKTD